MFLQNLWSDVTYHGLTWKLYFCKLPFGWKINLSYFDQNFDSPKGQRMLIKLIYRKSQSLASP